MVGEKKRYPCEHCGETFIRLRKHHNYAHPDLPFKPPENTQVERTHQCTLCEKKFTCAAHLRRHEKEVHLTNHILCPFPHCNKKFTDQSIVDRHVSNVHSNPELMQSQTEEPRNKLTEPKKLECTVCHKTYKFESRLKSHMKSHRKKEIKCTEVGCNLRFLRQSDLEKHIAAKHSGTKLAVVEDHPPVASAQERKKSDGKRFPCSYCDKSFKMRGHLNRHERSHTGEKPFKCEFENCGDSFPRKENLQTHIERVHKQQREERITHKCPHCDEDFIKESGLVNHLEKHKLGLLYNCEECSVVFGKKWKLNRHLSDVHGHQGTFVCEHENCGRRFFRLSLLQVHIRRRHTLHFCFEPECVEKEPFSTRTHLHNHNRKFHPPSPEGLVCDKCGRQCYSERGFARHKNWHKEVEAEAENMFPCDYPFCKHQFVSRVELVKHVSDKHLRKRPRKELEIESDCPICAENIPNNAGLFEHLRNEHDMTEEKAAEIVGKKSSTRKKRKATAVKVKKKTISRADDQPSHERNEDKLSSLEFDTVEINPKVLDRRRYNSSDSSDEDEDEEEIVYMDESSEEEEFIYVEGLDNEEMGDIEWPMSAESQKIAAEPLHLSGNTSKENACSDSSKPSAPFRELFPTSNQQADGVQSPNPLLLPPQSTFENNKDANSKLPTAVKSQCSSENSSISSQLCSQPTA